MILSAFHCSSEHQRHYVDNILDDEHENIEDFKAFGDQNYNDSLNSLCVILGAHSTKQSYVKRKIIDVKFPPNARFDSHADREDEHDFAMFVMDKPVEYSPKIRPICLPQTFADLDGQQLKVAGWGLTQHGNATDKLKKVDLNCCAGYNEYNNTLELVVRKKENVLQSVCEGDSGFLLV